MAGPVVESEQGSPYTAFTRLQKFGEEIWIADGPTVSFCGFPCPTRIALVRLESGDLWACSPVDVDPFAVPGGGGAPRLECW